MAGVLAAVCGQAMAAPISLPSLTDLPATVLPPAQIGLMAVLEFPEVPEAVFDDILQPPDRRAKKFDTAGQHPKTRDERVPEPPTALMFATTLLMGVSFWVLHGQMRKQGHRPFCRRVRRVWQMMA